MRLIEILDNVEPAMRLSNGKDVHTVEELSFAMAHDREEYAAERRQGLLTIYRVREDGVRRKVYREVN